MKKADDKEGMEWQNESDAELNSSEWFGAIIRYFFHLGKKKFNTFYNERELKKNALVGYAFKIVLLIGLVAIVYLFAYNS
ncbi:hypothetical protein H4O20_14520 [Aequorivita sp. 609]|uniref:hypothetical protein n=1 Tax=Aequorivita TaxID=153265 RepID=UPI0016132ACB|nr:MULTISPECIES: hypothetical protein [Aequorivita]MBB6682659.1 hypothetical protein [Aequorivita sp. 609]